MIELAEQIYEIIKDYQCDYKNRKFEITIEHIIKWANQFGNDAEFVLSELLHFLPDVYISKEKAKTFLHKRLLEIQEFYNYKTMNELVLNTHFFDVQKKYKSQTEILNITDEILQTEYMISYKDYIDNPKTNFIYFDDLLATGGTVYRDLSNWLASKDQNGIENYKSILNKSKTLAVSLFCYHQLGFGNMEFRLMKQFDDKIRNRLIVGHNYKIENQIKWSKQRLNCMYPIQEQSANSLEYLAKLEVPNENKRVSAFRPSNMPKEETFFSNADNRIKLEALFLEKGIELLNKVQKDNPDIRKRPLGDTVRSHKTFGTGTLFFTWRNISNTCPLVFWWDVPGHNWIPLFCLKNRGV
ncbi:phosphoribosyltransferase-like protein [Aquimarina latercula]|uniref:phosphoribosyltransferase-like protein n=1 Tax=Aquimarina latercula TaxID=987 RepID=UPI0003FE96DF|nr:hypothetical protein [Aquimarina latercula]